MFRAICQRGWFEAFRTGHVTVVVPALMLLALLPLLALVLLPEISSSRGRTVVRHRFRRSEINKPVAAQKIQYSLSFVGSQGSGRDSPWAWGSNGLRLPGPLPIEAGARQA
jgi:hypothetical protein